MNCENFEQVINDLARQQMIGVSDRTQAVEHIAACSRCETRLAEQQQLTDILESYASEAMAVKAPADLEVKLRDAFRAQRSQPEIVPAAMRFRQSRFYVAAAAALLFVVAFSIVWKFKDDDSNYASVIADASSPYLLPDEPSPPEKVTGVPAARKPAWREHRGKPTRRRALKPTVNVDLEASNLEVEVPTAFMPIGYSSAATVQEGGQVVRVELPRSAMARFGLPVNMERYDEHVKADVWVGADGLARAIRFVQ